VGLAPGQRPRAYADVGSALVKARQVLGADAFRAKTAAVLDYLAGRGFDPTEVRDYILPGVGSQAASLALTYPAALGLGLARGFGLWGSPTTLSDWWATRHTTPGEMWRSSPVTPQRMTPEDVVRQELRAYFQLSGQMPRGW
jgi:hypothetical protein